MAICMYLCVCVCVCMYVFLINLVIGSYVQYTNISGAVDYFRLPARRQGLVVVHMNTSGMLPEIGSFIK